MPNPNQSVSRPVNLNLPLTPAVNDAPEPPSTAANATEIPEARVQELESQRVETEQTKRETAEMAESNTSQELTGSESEDGLGDRETLPWRELAPMEEIFGVLEAWKEASEDDAEAALTERQTILNDRLPEPVASIVYLLAQADSERREGKVASTGERDNDNVGSTEEQSDHLQQLFADAADDLSMTVKSLKHYTCRFGAGGLNTYLEKMSDHDVEALIDDIGEVWDLRNGNELDQEGGSNSNESDSETDETAMNEREKSKVPSEKQTSPGSERASMPDLTSGESASENEGPPNKRRRRRPEGRSVSQGVW